MKTTFGAAESRKVVFTFQKSTEAGWLEKKLIIKLLLKITKLGITETELPLPKIGINYRITATETEVLKLPRPITTPKCWLPCPPLIFSSTQS